MNWVSDESLLSLLIALPLVGAIVIALAPRRAVQAQKLLGLGVAAASFVLSLLLVARFQNVPGMQFRLDVAWIPSFGIGYRVGIDGLSLWLVILTTLLTPLALLGSWRSITQHVKEFNVLMLLLETGMVGVFCAVDLFLFYVFWEAMLIPMYLLIGIWGHGRRIYAAVKFFLYTMAGSVFMLVAFLVLYANNPAGSFDLLELVERPVDPALQNWLFGAFALAFAIKVPMFPFHTWLPDAHVEAPTAGSVLLAGVLLKMGSYGFLRLAIPLFPSASENYAPWIGALAVVGILYGGLVCLVQTDLKKLVAYSSVAHMGFVMLGIAALTPLSTVGSVYQMLNHGISTAALFFMVGMLYERRHTRAIEDFGGLRNVMPRFTAVFLLISFSSIAVPGFNGFVGEFLILLGSWPKAPALTVLASLGVIIAAAYMLWMIQRVFYGEVTRAENETLDDVSPREWGVLFPLAALALFMGLASGLFTRKIEPTVNALILRVERERRASQPSTQPVIPPSATPTDPAAIGSTESVPEAVTEELE